MFYPPFDPYQMPMGMMPVTLPLPQDVPPHSRLFVACSRATPKEALEDLFAQYGRVEQVKMVTDRSTGAFKGSAFVKFERASAAATALEALHGHILDDVPLKVTFAEPKGCKPSESTDASEIPPRSRLFVTCPRETTREQLEALFGQYGEVEGIKMLADKATNQLKGIAYVKYTKASSAARAVEEVSAAAATATVARPVRCRVAEPRNAAQTGLPYMGFTHYPMYPVMDPSTGYTSLPDVGVYPTEYAAVSTSSAMSRPRAPGGRTGQRSTAEQRRDENNTPPGSRLFISFSKPLPVELLQTIFTRYGPLQTVYLVKGKNYGYAKYATAQAAQIAMANLNEKLVEGVACRIAVADPQKPGGGGAVGSPPRNDG